MSPNSSLIIEQLRIAIGGTTLLELDACIGAGEILTVMGPSGAGKSTLLAFIAGVQEPAFATSGRILLDGQDVTDVPAEKRRIGLLFQDALLFPHLSVGGNLLFGMPADVPDRQNQVAAALAEAGLPGFAARDPATLSGGQRARVALLRLMLSRPRAILLDEPFSRLDAALRQEQRALVFDRIRHAGLPALLVTHDPEDAAAAGGAILMPWRKP